MCKSMFVCGTSDFGSVVKYGLGVVVVISDVVKCGFACGTSDFAKALVKPRKSIAIAWTLHSSVVSCSL